jgi:hypothetical protein
MTIDGVVVVVVVVVGGGSTGLAGWFKDGVFSVQTVQVRPFKRKESLMSMHKFD